MNSFFLLAISSGLDSSSSAHCVQLLHNLSREGRTIVFTVHQPSAAIYEMFDQVYVLAQGQCVYRGSSNDTLSYLSENGLQCPMYHSLADFCEFSHFTLHTIDSAIMMKAIFYFEFSAVVLPLVIEVVNGDYGDFVPQLTTAANRSICYKSDKPTDFSVDDNDTPVIKVDSLACVDASLLKQQDGDSKDIDIITPPSEWSKFWTLVGRCQVCYYRDWVNRS